MLLMKRFTTFFALLSMAGLALFAAPMLGQNQQYPFPGYPAEFAPSRTVRIPPPAPPRAPQAKFTKLDNAVPNTYIVVLEDDELSNKGTATERRARVADLARGMLPAGAEIQSVFGTVFRGFSVKLPNEAVAIALSKHPRVEFVESDGLDGSLTDTQSNAPGGLDRIDQASGLDTNYTYNRTGSGVTIYDIGPGVRTTHEEFKPPGSPSRAFIAADLVAADNITEINTCTVTSTSNDCDGHGTSMLGIVGGTTYGVAKGATLKSVKVLYLEPNPSNPSQAQQNLSRSRTARGIEWVTDYHNANPTQLEVANCSFQFGSADLPISRAIKASFKAGVTYAISAGNNNTNAQYSPSEVGNHYALVTGAENQTDDNRFVFASPNTALSSDFGSKLALWSPGFNIPSATSGTPSARNSSDTLTNSSPGTSRASAHTAGAVALYLQGRTGMNDCGSHKINGPSSTTTGTAIATCPDRVKQFIMANSTLNALVTTGSGAIGTGSPNRLLFTGSIPTTTNFNPIDNHRFFVWQQYGDFLPEVTNPNDDTTIPQDHLIPVSPDENGLDWWTSEITGHGHCTAGVNDNNSCTNTWRINTSRAFWVDQHPELFNTSYGLNSGKNGEFVELCYQIYLKRPSDTAGYNNWLSVLNSYGDPANGYGVVHLIDAFINSPEYRQRFGGS
jgi:hypothetical protein